MHADSVENNKGLVATVAKEVADGEAKEAQADMAAKAARSNCG